MRKLTLIVVFILSDIGMFAQNAKRIADTAFFNFYGGTGSDEIRSIKELPGGGYILAGNTESFGQGNTSVYLVKTDSLGNHLWSAPFGGSQGDWAYSIEVTNDSGYFVAGYSTSFNAQNDYDTYYFKTDKNGNLQWQKIVSGSDWDFIYGTTLMPDGGFILCGETYTNSNGGSDAYLIRLDKNGNVIWNKHYGGIFDETFNSVTIINNRIYAVGKNATHPTDTVSDGWIVKLDTNGIILKDTFVFSSSHYEEILEDITPYTYANDTIFHVCGKANLIDSGSTITILGRIDTSLHFIFMNENGVTSPGSIKNFNKVVNLSNGNYCAIGSNNGGGFGGLSLFTAGFNSGGWFITDFAFDGGGDKDEYGYDGIYTKSGRVIAVGSSASDQFYCPTSGLGLEDMFLERFNSDSIRNSSTVTPVQIAKCFLDTLFLWEPATRYFENDIKLKLFPNPANNQAQLEIISKTEKTFIVKIFSVLGIEKNVFKVKTNFTNTLDVSKLAAGNYYLKLLDENGQNLSVIKFVKVE